MELSAYYDHVNHIVIVASEQEDVVTTDKIKYATGLAMRLAHEHQCDFLLFDITNMKESQSLIQGFLDMSDLNKTTGLTAQFKCAVIYNPATYSDGRASFIEAVVTNRPNPMFKMFRTREAAIEWLKGR